MRLRNQKGFSAVEFLIVAVILGVVGFVGYTVYDRQQNKVATESSQASDVSDAPVIEDTNDLDAAAVTLDQTDTSSSSDSAELDSHLNSF